MEITAGNINALSTRINLAFNRPLGVVQPTWQKFALEMPSTSAANFFPRMSELPGIREWLGPRQIHQLSTADRMVLVNRTFEESFSVKREDLEDDTYGYIFPWVEALGQDAATFPDKLVYETLSKGRASKCMDGQNFFDTDHEATNSTGKTVSYANMSTIAAGEAAQPWWYLFDTSKPLKAMIFQNRRPFTITPRTQLNSENVFMHREFQWGTDGRCTAGYGMYQFAFCSNRPLTGAVFQDAIARMASQCRRDGTPYGVQPTVMVVPRNLEGAARTLLKSTLVMSLADDGKTYGPASNVWADYCDLLVSDRLPQAVGA
ncbi:MULTISPECIES: Mu-like prophage major head subunit gpT family protein [Acetobacter]|uniref:Phage major head subunit gpT-like protein n=1 Tax=Acetobacter lovaniensis TaxID=104100 RepID=A0A841QHE3_9PROT|nr:Mu-like prophage major head subunit gpT family protein [Acetobacter lovaniensis]MBB6457457.1 phage major head subunit gpT-like protein [Acetobacter lovaniensis]NHN81755.1 head protein [Acetobacter lovaniensis]GBQ70883.1 Mu-like prophage major head subunit gpT [Acetobacter lovaniensis NRIC 0474]